MAKAISSAADVLAAIAGKNDVFETDGVTVELRSLAWDEVQSILARFPNDNMEQLFQFALAGLASPKLEEAQLRKGRSSFVTAVGGRVAQISGAKDDDRPLAGTGSPPSPPTAQPT